MADEPELPEDLTLWPENQELEPGDLVREACGSCGREWGIHKDLAGFRLRCRCGSWVEVPWPSSAEAPQELTEGTTSNLQPALPTETPGGLVRLAERPPGELIDDAVPTRVPLDAGQLRFANVSTRARWTNRGILEMLAVLLAYWIPAGIALVTLGPRAFGTALPLLMVGSSTLVLLVLARAPRYSFGGLKWPPPGYLLEAPVVAFAFAGLAMLWQQLLSGQGIWQSEVEALRSDLGVPLLLFTLGLCPGVFEELAFRGLLQGRFAALLGENQAILVVGVAFALAHGISLGTPILMAAGIYLCWLRVRSDSVIPCMVLHTTYNCALFLLA